MLVSVICLGLLSLASQLDAASIETEASAVFPVKQLPPFRTEIRRQGNGYRGNTGSQFIVFGDNTKVAEPEDDGNSFMDIITSPREYFTSLMSDVSDYFMGNEEGSSDNKQRAPIRYKEVPFQGNQHGHAFLPHSSLPPFLQQQHGQQPQQLGYQPGQLGFQSQQLGHQPPTQDEQYKPRNPYQSFQGEQQNPSSPFQSSFLNEQHTTKSPFQSFQSEHHKTNSPFQPSLPAPQNPFSSFSSSSSLTQQPFFGFGNQLQYQDFPQQKAQDKNDGHWTGSYSSHYRQMVGDSADNFVPFVNRNQNRRQINQKNPALSHNIQEHGDSIRTKKSTAHSGLLSDDEIYKIRRSPTKFDARRLPTNQQTETRDLTDFPSFVGYETLPQINEFTKRSSYINPRLNWQNRKYYVQSNKLRASPLDDVKIADPTSSQKWETWGALIGKRGSAYKREASSGSNKLTTSASRSRFQTESERELHPVSDVVDALKIVVEALEHTPSDEKIFLARTGEALE